VGHARIVFDVRFMERPIMTAISLRYSAADDDDNQPLQSTPPTRWL